jgi:DNA-binding transcriptional LysR family regulator
LAFSQRLGPDAQRALLRDELDIAVGRFGEPEDDVVLTPLFEDRYCVVARRDHPKLRRTLKTEHFAELSQVQVSVSADFRLPDFMPLQAAAAMPRVVAAVPRFSIALSVVASSDAIAIVPEGLARSHARQLGLRLHAMPFRVEPIAIFAARRAHADAGTLFLLEQLQLAALPSSVSLQAAPAKFTPEQVTGIIALARESPSDSGLPVSHWTPPELARERCFAKSRETM